MHATEQLYVPELIFGRLLTGSNFIDSTTKKGNTVGGRHGYGAKLTNIFSKEFHLDTVCDGLRYQQTWRNNMKTVEDSIITSSHTENDDYTRVTFVPDLERLGKQLTSDDMGNSG
mmetsp:Transcript_37682/g.41621  ORF Transcript_37682/g.41621 Transcript_37682/m.41621 type:complete len:115 (+) Transcript_37682:496-840(+)